jgi:hypothetical protein
VRAAQHPREPLGRTLKPTSGGMSTSITGYLATIGTSEPYASTTAKSERLLTGRLTRTTPELTAR